MIFANPLAFYGLGLLAIPIAIHLINLRRAKKVYFSNVALLSQIQISTNAINRLKSILILICRLIFIAALVFAFARPISKTEKKSIEGQVAIMVDNTMSMQNQTSGKTLLNLSVSAAEKIANSYPNQTQFYFGTLSQWQQVDLLRLEEKLSQLEYSTTDHNIVEQMEKLKKKALAKPTSIYIFSDFQKTSFGNLSDLVIDTAIQYYLVPVTAEDKENLAIDSIWLQTPYLQTNISNSVWVRVKNYGKHTTENLAVSLFVNDVQSGVANIKVEANSQKDVELALMVKNPGIFTGKVEIQDNNIPFDDRYYFSVRVAQMVSVSHISDNATVYIKSVFSDSTFFDYAFFNPLKINFARMASCDLIVVENVEKPSLALIEELIRSLERGASVCVIPSAKQTKEHWQALAQYGTATAQAALNLSVPDPNEPYFEGVFEELPTLALMPSAKAILIPKTGRAILSLKDNTPFFTTTSISKGKLYLFACPLESEFTDLPKNGLFVPLMFKMAFSSVAANENLAYRLDAKFATLPIRGLQNNDIFSLGKGGFIPEQKASASTWLMSIPTSELKAGTYDVLRMRDDSTVGKISFNYSKNESQTECHSTDELKTAFGSLPNVKIVSGASVPEITNKIEQTKNGIPFWKWFVLVALLALAAETVLIRLSKASYRKPSSQPNP